MLGLASAVTDGQAAAIPEGEIRLLLSRSGRDLQRLIGDFEGKDIFVSLFKTHQSVLHRLILMLMGEFRRFGFTPVI